MFINCVRSKRDGLGVLECDSLTVVEQSALLPNIQRFDLAHRNASFQAPGIQRRSFPVRHAIEERDSQKYFGGARPEQRGVKYGSIFVSLMPKERPEIPRTGICRFGRNSHDRRGGWKIAAINCAPKPKAARQPTSGGNSLRT